MLRTVAQEMLRGDGAGAANAPTQLVLDGAEVDGRPRHPYAIVSTASAVRVYLDTPPTAAERLGGRSVAVTLGNLNTKNMFHVARALNEHAPVSELSGLLGRMYRGTMHNAERVFQACTVVAARLPERTIGQMAVGCAASAFDAAGDDGVPRAAALAVAVCIGTAIARADTGTGVRVLLKTSDDAEVARASAAIVRACHALEADGVRAVPFGEVCMSFALL